MRLLSLRAARFGALVGRDFELDGRAFVLEGPNEAGKSSFHAAVETVLYGFKPATREAHPYARWDDGARALELSAVVELESGARLFVERRLTSSGAARITPLDREPSGAFGRNDALAELQAIPRELFRAVYSLTANDALEPTDEGLRDLVDELLLGSTERVGARPLRALLAELAEERAKLWRPDQRGTPRDRALQEELHTLRRALRDASAAQRALAVDEQKLHEVRIELRRLVAERTAIVDELEARSVLCELVRIDRATLEMARIDLSGFAPLDDGFGASDVGSSASASAARVMLEDPTVLARQDEELSAEVDAFRAQLGTPEKPGPQHGPELESAHIAGNAPANYAAWERLETLAPRIEHLAAEEAEARSEQAEHTRLAGEAEASCARAIEYAAGRAPLLAEAMTAAWPLRGAASGRRTGARRSGIGADSLGRDSLGAGTLDAGTLDAGTLDAGAVGAGTLGPGGVGPSGAGSSGIGPSARGSGALESSAQDRGTPDPFAAAPLEAARSAAVAWRAEQEERTNEALAARGSHGVAFALGGLATLVLGGAAADLWPPTVAPYALPSGIAAACAAALVVLARGRTAERRRRASERVPKPLRELGRRLGLDETCTVRPDTLLEALSDLDEAREAWRTAQHQLGESERVKARVEARRHRWVRLAEAAGIAAATELPAEAIPAALRRALDAARSSAAAALERARVRAQQLELLRQRAAAMQAVRARRSALEAALQRALPHVLDPGEAFRVLRALSRERATLEGERSQLARHPRFAELQRDPRRADPAAHGLEDRARDAELAARRDALQEELAAHHRTEGELVERLRSAAPADPGELRARITACEAELVDVRRRHDRLALVERALRLGERRHRIEHQPDVLRAASEHLARITGSRYTRLDYPDPERRVLVVHSTDLGAEVPVGPPLSRGVREQVHLCLRLGTLEHLDRGREPLPLVLDEALVHWDPARRAALYPTLRALTDRRQVILLTCQPELAQEAVELLGARHVRLARAPETPWPTADRIG
jgi:uncharacterized protein YhaN